MVVNAELAYNDGLGIGLGSDVGQISDNEGESGLPCGCIILCPDRVYLLPLGLSRLPLWFGDIGLWRSSHGESHNDFLICLCRPQSRY